jgi:hypothetical protein
MPSSGMLCHVALLLTTATQCNIPEDGILHLSDSCHIQNGLKQRDVLSSLLLKVQENQLELKLNGTHQLLAYADDVNLLGDSIHTTHRNTETLIDAVRRLV